jgi:hypothetical protein
MLAENAGLVKPTEFDHRAWLWVAVIISMIYSLVFLLARLFAKYEMLWWDDGVSGVAYVGSTVFESICLSDGAPD